MPAKVFESIWLNVSVEYRFRWRTVGGRRLGTKVLDHNSVADYYCASSCTVYADPEVGAYIHHHIG